MAQWVYGRGIPREEIIRHLELILDLRDSTSPERGESFAESKHQRALQAIKLFSYMAVGAAGWAFNHAAGRALDPEAHEDEHVHETRGEDILDRDFTMRRENAPGASRVVEMP